MTFAVAKPVAAYLAAETAKDADAISRCFTEDAIVRDDGLDYRGRDAIRHGKRRQTQNTTMFWFRSAFARREPS